MDDSESLTLLRTLESERGTYGAANLVGAMVRLLALVVAFLVPARGRNRTKVASQVVVCWASPTAHGASLLRDVMSSFGDMDATAMFDPRFAEKGLPSHSNFPAVSAVSMIGHTSFRDALSGLHTVWFGLRNGLAWHGLTGRLVWIYLAAAQGARYSIARTRFTMVRPATLICDFDRAPACVPIVLAARRAGWRTATLVHGSPSETYLVGSPGTELEFAL